VTFILLPTFYCRLFVCCQGQELYFTHSYTCAAMIFPLRCYKANLQRANLMIFIFLLFITCTLFVCSPLFVVLTDRCLLMTGGRFRLWVFSPTLQRVCVRDNCIFLPVVCCCSLPSNSFVCLFLLFCFSFFFCLCYCRLVHDFFLAACLLLLSLLLCVVVVGHLLYEQCYCKKCLPLYTPLY